jgi:hypothetical protein
MFQQLQFGLLFNSLMLLAGFQHALCNLPRQVASGNLSSGICRRN